MGHFQTGGLSLTQRAALHWLQGCPCQPGITLPSPARTALSAGAAALRESESVEKTQDLPSKVGNVPLCKLWQSLSPEYQVWSG